MSAHTPGPWRSAGGGIVRYEGAGPVAKVDGGDWYAQRLVACANACEGIPQDKLVSGLRLGVISETLASDPAFDDAIALLKRIVRETRRIGDGERMEPIDTATLNEARALIAKAEGRA